MEFRKSQLRKMIKGKPLFKEFPNQLNSKEEVERNIHRLFDQLNESDQFICDGEFNHYGSGYASFVEFFCVKKDGSAVLSESYHEKDSVTSLDLEGVVVYVSRLAPLAVFGMDNRLKYIQEEDGEKLEMYSGTSYLGVDKINHVPEKFEHVVEEIRNRLFEAGYLIGDQTYLKQPLPFKAAIPTILTMPDFGEEYTIFDAIFYWSD
ncbi:hypothetical protein L2D08_17625 [Domibacillus sp. PGB-M46]|uniref:hypothetical protein n=1 Tax=Domibacillus sp. PGB-M46 TaxID=2910255 RepID=UPI001F598B55|nr:hypothetical protein [Domibacillus sp. PGB-M46]MCI2256171.1 hypothetical protein [Domibacillus sp. PGB-M46]